MENNEKVVHAVWNPEKGVRRSVLSGMRNLDG